MTHSKSLIRQSTPCISKVQLSSVTFAEIQLHTGPKVDLRPPVPKRLWIEDCLFTSWDMGCFVPIIQASQILTADLTVGNHMIPDPAKV